MARKQISETVKKQLFALSGNQCCFPGCKERVYKVEDAVLLGEMCHICAVNPSGARHNAELTEDEVNSFDNLLVMCPTHHTTIDNNEEKYTIEFLRRIKSEHSSKFYDNAGLFDNTVEKLEGEINVDTLNELEALDQTIKEVSHEKALPPKKLYLATENYIIRSITPTRDDLDNISLELSTLSDVLEKQDRLTILGVAGSGKSVELAHLAHKHSRSDSDLFPVKIRLNVLTTQAIEDLLRIEYPEFDLVQEEHLLILLDALDEVHADFIDIVASKIEILSKKYSKAKIVVTCRNNFYITETAKRSAKLEGFRSYHIQPLQYASIYNYLEGKIDIPPDDFISDLRQKRFYNLLYSPFYLIHLVEIFILNGEIPNSKKTVFELLINERLKQDLEKFKNSGLSLSNHTLQIRNQIQELAVLGEGLGRNYLHNESEIQQYIADPSTLERIKRTFLFNESHSNDKWEFEHNNFQEFLAAEFLSKLPVLKIKEFISFKPDFVKIKPSWLNTVSFLFSIIGKNDERFNDLLTWIKSIEPDVLIRFEKDKIDRTIRERLFIEIYEEYESKGIIIRNEKFESEDLATFVSDSTALIEYLVKKIEESSDRLILTEALRILPYFDETDQYKRRLRELLEAKLCNPDLSDEIKYACFNALDSLGISDEDLTVNILNNNDLESSQYIRAGIYRYLNSSGQYEEHMSLLIRGVELLEGIKVSINRTTPSTDTNLWDEKATLEKVLDKIEEPDNILSFLKWAEQAEEPTKMEGVYFRQIEKMLEKASKYSDEAPEFFDVVLSLLKSSSRRYQKRLNRNFQSYFEEVNSSLKAFKTLYSDWLNGGKKDFHLTSAMAVICNSECISFLVPEINQGQFKEPHTWQFRNALGWEGTQVMYDLYQKELMKVDSEKYAFKNIDHAALESARRKRDVELILSKEDFLSEVKRIFHEESSVENKLTWDEVYNWKKTNFNDEEMSNHLATETLREFAKDKKFVTLQEIDKMVSDQKRWKWFQIFKIVEYDRNLDDFEYTDELKKLINEWVDSELKSANFHTAIEYREENKYHYRYSELYVSYFIQRIDINVSDEVLLDMLSVQCYLLPTRNVKSNEENQEKRKPNTLDYVEDKLGLKKVAKRIISDLKNEVLVPAVKQSYFDFCAYRKIKEAAPFILNEIKSTERSEYEKRTLISHYVTLDSDLHELLDAYALLIIEMKLHLSEELAKKGFKAVIPKIQEAILKEEREEIKFRLISILFKIDESEGFSCLKKWILANKRLPERTGHFNYYAKATISDLIELFEDSLNHDYGTGFWSDRKVLIQQLVHKGSLSEENYLSVKSQLNAWIKQYKDMEYMYYQIQNLEQLYYSKKSGTIEFYEVVKMIQECRK